MADYLTFPYKDHENRLDGYSYYSKLFHGDHFDAFSIKIDDKNYNKAYAKLRYVTVNFAGLISKVVADFLFSEPIQLKTEAGEQEFLEALSHENNLDVQNYESALSNSYMGDALFKLRIGKRQSTDKKPTVIIEDITPTIYFPHIDGFNVRQKPEKEELAWLFKHGDKEYLRQEIHTPGRIEYKIYEMKDQKIMNEVDPKEVGLDLPEFEETGIEKNTIIHIPNWKTGNRFFGISDYYDLDSIFYAINNRMTKTDNILDKHSDPILAVPEGVLDEDGEVKREKLNMLEIPDGATGSQGKPEYIIWNASLENAFKEVEKLVEFMYMISETSPDILGMGKGQSDSGRALKLKLLRTIAKASRKKLYYDYALKETIYIAQLLAKANNVEVGGIKLKGEPVVPEIQWFDGLPIDNSEQVETEIKRIDAGLSTTKDSIMRIDGVDEEEAEKTVTAIKDENTITLPVTKTTPDTQ